jgi:membrane protease YdiL (CAAX protease family)
MISVASDQPEMGQLKPWVQLLAILLGVGPVYIPTIISHLQRSQPLSAKDIFFYTTIFGSIMIIIMLLILKYLCGERIRDLNLKKDRWWKDILMGLGLTVLTLGSLVLLRDPINSVFPREPDSGLGDFFNEVVTNPLLFGLVMGPVLIIGAGVFEELTRVFLLSRLWKLSPSRVWRWSAILLSAALFGLAHIYQGPAGVVSTGISGLILAVAYHYTGRVIPLMLSHYLHDAVQFAAIYIMANVT